MEERKGLFGIGKTKTITGKDGKQRMIGVLNIPVVGFPGTKDSNKDEVYWSLDTRYIDRKKAKKQ